MTFDEFIHWLDGFSYAFIDGAPSATQYAIIKEKLKEVSKHKSTPIYRNYPGINNPIFDPIQSWNTGNPPNDGVVTIT